MIKNLILAVAVMVSLSNAASSIRSTFLNDTNIVKEKKDTLVIRKERLGTIYDITTTAPNTLMLTKDGRRYDFFDIVANSANVVMDTLAIVNEFSRIGLYKECSASILIPIEEYERFYNKSYLSLNNNGCVLGDISTVGGGFFLGKTIGKVFKKNHRYKSIELDVKTTELAYIDSINIVGLYGDTTYYDFDKTFMCKDNNSFITFKDNYVDCQSCPMNSVYSEKYGECICKVGYKAEYGYKGVYGYTNGMRCVEEKVEPINEIKVEPKTFLGNDHRADVRFDKFNVSTDFGMSTKSDDGYSDGGFVINLSWQPSIILNHISSNTDIMAFALDLGMNFTYFSYEYDGLWGHSDSEGEYLFPNIALGFRADLWRFEYTFDFLVNLNDKYENVSYTFGYQNRIGFKVNKHWAIHMNIQNFSGLTFLGLGCNYTF